MTTTTIITPSGKKVTSEVMDAKPWQKLVSQETLASVDRMIVSAKARADLEPCLKKIAQDKKALKIKNPRQFPKTCYAKNKPGRKPGTVSPMKGKSYNERYAVVKNPTKERPCMCCQKVFNSEGSHNRLCCHCRHLTDD